jgi:hypothetical protein
MLRIEFETDNAAFNDAPEFEVARILREMADRIELLGGGFYSGPVRDVNGNKIGSAVFDPALTLEEA